MVEWGTEEASVVVIVVDAAAAVVPTNMPGVSALLAALFEVAVVGAAVLRFVVVSADSTAFAGVTKVKATRVTTHRSYC